MSVPVYLEEFDSTIEQQKQEKKQEKQKITNIAKKAADLSKQKVEIIPIDDKRLYKLPEIVNFNNFDESFKMRTLNTDLDIVGIITPVHNYLKQNLTKYDINHKYYEFFLPPSIFESFQKPVLDFIQPKSSNYEVKLVKKLNEKQLSQIRKDGKFEVESSIYPIPYTWRLHPLIIKGTQEILETKYQNISLSYEILFQYPKNFRQFLKSFKNAKNLVFNVLNLIMGLRSMQCNLTPSIIEKYFDDQRQMQIIEQYKSQIIVDFFTFLLGSDIPDDQYNLSNKKNEIMKKRMNVLNKINNEFDSLIKQSKKEFRQQARINFLNQKKQTDEETFIFEQEKQMWNDLIYKLISKSDLKADLKNQLKELLQAVEIFNEEIEQNSNQISKQSEQITERLKNQHKIRKYNQEWLKTQINNNLEPIKQKLKDEEIQNIKKRLSQNNLKSSLILYQEYIQFMGKYENTYRDTKELLTPQHTSAQREFITTKYLFPPYERVQDQQGQWSLIRYKNYYTFTDCFMWRYRLMAIRYYVWSINIAIILYHTGINSSYGIKALYKTHEFATMVQINYKTGEIYYDSYVKPFYVVQGEIYDGIKKSRQLFESKPDTGFFGKNLSRIFNLIECYVFRLMIYLFYFVIKPVLIISYTIFALISAFTSFLWIPFAIVLRLLINMIIYDFDRPQKRERRPVPLIIITVELITKVLFNLLASIFKIIIMPLIMLLIIIYSYTRNLLAHLSDGIMFFMVKSLGRQPISDTKIARKVGGIGISRKYYHTLDKNDFLILLQCELENLELHSYNEIMLKKIKEPTQNCARVIHSIFNPLNTTASVPPEVTQSVSYLTDSLNKKIFNRKKKFPNMVHEQIMKVRFSQDELDDIFPISQKVVEEFLKSRNLQQHAYQFYNVDPDESIIHLIEAIWRAIFHNSEVLNPLEEIETRFTIERVQDSHGYNEICNAISGNINLSSFTSKLQGKFLKFKKEALDKIVTVEKTVTVAREYFNIGPWMKQHPNYSIFVNTNVLNIPQNNDQKKKQ